MADVKKILRKRKWTGREVGIIELTNLSVVFDQILRGKEQKPVVSDDDIQEMKNSLTDAHDIAVYNQYIAVHKWLSMHFYMMQTQFVQAAWQAETLEHMTLEAYIAESANEYMEKLPAIMTGKQYEDFKASRIEDYFKDADGNERMATAYDLILDATLYYLHLMEDNPEAANPLKAVKKKYLEQPIKSEYILTNWNDVMENGYYTLPDGRRSDEMEPEEWEKVTANTMTFDDIAKEHAQLIFNGEFDGKSQEEVFEEKRKIFNKGTVPTEWHPYTEQPEGLTKWDVVGGYLLDFYGIDENPSLELMKDFKKEFSTLVTAITKDIDKRYFKGRKGLYKLPVEDWTGFRVSMRELYELDFYDTREKAGGREHLLDGSWRAVSNGVAILRQEDKDAHNINDAGYYVEPKISDTLSPYTLDNYLPESEIYASTAEAIESAHSILLSSYLYLTGYNYVMDRVALFYDVPELHIFKIEMGEIHALIKAYNGGVARLMNFVFPRDETAGKKKVEAIKLFFYPIDHEKVVIPEDVKEQIDEMIRDGSAFSKQGVNTFNAIIGLRGLFDESTWRDCHD